MRARRVDPIRRHVWRLRAVGVAFLFAGAACGWLSLALAGRRAVWPSPLAVTGLAGVLGLALALTAERSARVRLDRARRTYASNGDRDRLLRDHLHVYLLVQLRLAAVALLGLVTTAWGTGAMAGNGLIAVAVALMLLAWPTEAKTETLLVHAEEERRGGCQHASVGSSQRSADS